MSHPANSRRRFDDDNNGVVVHPVEYVVQPCRILQPGRGGRAGGAAWGGHSASGTLSVGAPSEAEARSATWPHPPSAPVGARRQLEPWRLLSGALCIPPKTIPRGVVVPLAPHFF